MYQSIVQSMPSTPTIIKQVFVMNFHSSMIKESDEDLLGDTQVEIPGLLQELMHKMELLEQEAMSLQMAKKASEKEAFKVINDDLYQTLIALNEENASLRKAYKDMMNDKQLKKENYYRQNENDSSLRSSGNFSLSSAKLQQVTTPKHSKNLLNQQLAERKSFCVSKRGMTVSRQSFDSKLRPKEAEATLHSDNIFLNLFSLMVEEQKQTQKELFNEVKFQRIERDIRGDNFKHLAEVETCLESTYIKVERMMGLMRLYQDKLDKSSKECDQLQGIINEYTGAKLRLDSIFSKIQKVPQMRSDIKEKQEYIDCHQTEPKEKPSSFQNLELLLKMLDYSEGSQLSRLKSLNKDSHLLLLDPRQSKLRQLIESIQTGRSKFKQIFNIYMDRIRSLEQKLQELK